jgi:hypothetical protein
MHQELKDSYIPIVTAKKNLGTLYYGRNATRKQLEPL